MSKPTPIRSKRPLSPTADTSIDDRRKMLRANHEHAEDNKKILSLTSNQHTQIIRQLIDSNPAAREAILALVPSLPPVPTQSRFFASEVEELVPLLSGERRNSRADCCTFMRHAAGSTVQRMNVEFHMATDIIYENDLPWYETLNAFHGPEKSTRLNYAHGSRDDYLMDMCIAIMDINLLMSQRVPFANIRRRARNPDERYVNCIGCGSSVSREYIAKTEYRGAEHLAGLMRSILWTWAWEGGTERRADEKTWTGDWILALLYESPDGSTHPFRSAVSRYIILPPLLPSKSPNDPWTMKDPLVGSHHARLSDILNTLPQLIQSGDMLATEPSPISALDNLSSSNTSSPVQEPESDQ